MALAALEGDAEAIAPLQAWGLVLPHSAETVSYQLRHRWGTTVNVLPVRQLPDALRLPIADARTAAVVAYGDPLHEALTAVGVATVLAVPLPEGRGLLFAGGAGPEPFTSAHAAALQSLGCRLVQQAVIPESEASQLERMERLDALADVLPHMASALDVREIFERLAKVASRVIPHESAVVGINSEDRTEIRLYALSGEAARDGIPPVVPSPYPAAVVDTREFAIVRDLVNHPVERNGLAARLGFRSALRMPLWVDGRIKGVLDFSSRETDRYTEADLPVARRIADYVTLALSHKEIADKTQHAATIAERTSNLQVLEELLSTLMGVLDVREVFHRVSAIVQTVLPHDALSIPVVIPGTDRVRIYANTGFSDEPVIASSSLTSSLIVVFTPIPML